MSVLQVTPSGTAGGRAPALEPVRSPSAPRAVLWVPPSGHLAVFTKSGEEPAAKQAMRGPRGAHRAGASASSSLKGTPPYWDTPTFIGPGAGAACLFRLQGSWF